MLEETGTQGPVVKCWQEQIGSYLGSLEFSQAGA